VASTALAVFALLFITPFVLYPLGVMALARLLPRRERCEGSSPLPRIAILIAARDEEGALEAKLANTLALDYPPELRVIRVLSDASMDRTDAVVRAHAAEGVQLFRVDSSLGKTETAVRGVAGLDADVLVFTDATSEVSSEALRALVGAVSEPGVGCATGRITWSGGEGAIGRGFRVYAHVDSALRRAEARVGGAVVVSGALHAVRRTVFAPAPPDLSYDLVLPFLASSRGLRTEYVDEAVALEAARERVATEWRARVRLGVRSFRFARWAFSGASPSPQVGWWFHFMGHKFLRWLGGLWLVGAGIAAGFGAAESTVSLAVGLAVGAGLAAALLALLPGGRRLPGAGFALFVWTVLAAYVVALGQTWMGRRVDGWSPEREEVRPRETI
jgi:cellulose synthase/poly-beta-1,6-N-acetylglucosamine synthase-like glycosyltransferase